MIFLYYTRLVGFYVEDFEKLPKYDKTKTIPLTADRNVSDVFLKTGVGENTEEKVLCKRHVISVKTHKTPLNDLQFGRQGGRGTVHVGNSRPWLNTYTAAGRDEKKTDRGPQNTPKSRLVFSTRVTQVVVVGVVDVVLTRSRMLVKAVER